jgi:hypothetical protein
MGTYFGVFSRAPDLSRGWFGFVFKNPEDTGLILERLWDYEGK